MNIPNDPIMLMSFLNTQLRDNYPSLSELAQSYGISEDEILQKMEAIGYKYDVDKNQMIRSIV